MIQSEIQSATHDNSSAADARRMVERSRLIGQFHLMYVINRSGGFQIVECALFMPDAA